MDENTAAALNAHEFILEVMFSTLLPHVPVSIADSALNQIRSPAGIKLAKGSGPVDLEVLSARRDLALKHLQRFADKVESRR